MNRILKYSLLGLAIGGLVATSCGIFRYYSSKHEEPVVESPAPPSAETDERDAGEEEFKEVISERDAGELADKVEVETDYTARAPLEVKCGHNNGYVDVPYRLTKIWTGSTFEYEPLELNSDTVYWCSAADTQLDIVKDAKLEVIVDTSSADGGSSSSKHELRTRFDSETGIVRFRLDKGDYELNLDVKTKRKGSIGETRTLRFTSVSQSGLENDRGSRGEYNRGSSRNYEGR